MKNIKFVRSQKYLRLYSEKLYFLNLNWYYEMLELARASQNERRATIRANRGDD